MKIHSYLRGHKILSCVVLAYAVLLLAAKLCADSAGNPPEWISLLLLCPVLLGIAAGMARQLSLYPERYPSVRPRLLILTCVVTAGICIVESLICLAAAAFS